MESIVESMLDKELKELQENEEPGTKHEEPESEEELQQRLVEILLRRTITLTRRGNLSWLRDTPDEEKYQAAVLVHDIFKIAKEYRDQKIEQIQVNFYISRIAGTGCEKDEIQFRLEAHHCNHDILIKKCGCVGDRVSDLLYELFSAVRLEKEHIGLRLWTKVLDVMEQEPP